MCKSRADIQCKYQAHKGEALKEKEKMDGGKAKEDITLGEIK